MGGTIYLTYLTKLLRAARGDEQLFATIVNAPFHNRVAATQLDLGIVVFLLVDKAGGTINRIALSDTEQAKGAVKMSEKPFHEIKIPLDHKVNAIAQAIQTGTPQVVTDWKYLFIPDMSPRAARFNQAGAGVECSCVYPLAGREGGALIFSYYQVSANIGDQHRQFMTQYAKIVSEHLQKSANYPSATKSSTSRSKRPPRASNASSLNTRL